MSGLVPALKWAGGKRWLVKKFGSYFPSEVDRYVEPFLGGAAVFFDRCYERAFLADANEELINCYQVIRDSWPELEAGLSVLHASHSSDTYYKMRAAEPSDKVERAVRFLYLNRTCWNGLYRVNRKGRFNVPIGTKASVILPTDDFELLSSALTNVKLEHKDFRETLAQVTSYDFVYVDPPYTVKHDCNGFVKYNERIFSWKDQEVLRDEVERLSKLGAQILVSQANHASIRELYEGLGDMSIVDRKSVIAGNKVHRSKVQELLITINY